MVTGRKILDAAVIGSGPNGLAAAVVLAQGGYSVRVYESESVAGGGLRSAELTQPGFVHDICSTIHAFALASPLLRTLPLADYGVQFVHPQVPLAHPLNDGSAVVVERSVALTAASLGPDARPYMAIFAPLVEASDLLMEALLRPVGFHHPRLLASFGKDAIRSVTGLTKAKFRSERTCALLAGVAAHSMLPLSNLATAGFAMALITTAHAFGWPVVRGGSQNLADALVQYIRNLGGETVTNMRIESLNQLPPSRAVLCDISPRSLARVAGDRLPVRYRRRLGRYRHGPGVFKMDFALSAPVPWRASECARAGTVHLGGTFAEIADSELAVSEGRVHEKPYVIVVQPTLFDSTRAPAHRHTLWAYCHVPNGSTTDMSNAIERQIERFAPGFRDCIISRHAMFPADLERHNANLVGGDIGGGAATIGQLFTRPLIRVDPYSTPAPGLYLCSSSTPPGVGVHGMCGFYAAHSAVRNCLGQGIPRAINSV
jgi:phytoene dehydrogenase-like protein